MNRIMAEIHNAKLKGTTREIYDRVIIPKNNNISNNKEIWSCIQLYDYIGNTLKGNGNIHFLCL